MLRTSESETEILLGNKQLLGIFLVVAVLLGVSFTGGFLIGRGSFAKKGITAAAATPEPGPNQTATGGQTHTLDGETTLPAAASGGADAEAAGPASRTQQSDAASDDASKTQEPVLGTRKRAASPMAVSSAKPSTSEMEAKSSKPDGPGYTPHAGSEYLQVVAVGHDEALAVADVLHKKGFRAHAVPKPGNAKLYRVIIGPVKDAGELSSTRDALRKTGFREVIVQRY